MPILDPPGHLADLTPEQAQAWSHWLSDELDRARAEDGREQGLTNDGPRLQFFNPLKNAAAADAVQKDISWSAFPRLVQIQSVSDRQRWQTADGSRDRQDEYCEWCVTRDPATNKITKVAFTSEGPEYWTFLASVNPEKILALYQEHVDPRVTMQDLFDEGGKYIERNRWNDSTQSGIMHLVQSNNTLSAEIELAAASTIVRKRNGVELTSEPELIACGKYGQAQRHSDPHIGAEVNALARARNDVTLANPIGLYIAGLSVNGWTTPDGSAPADYWKITRGTSDKGLRAVYEVPAGKGFAVGDIKINGHAIEFGAQIVDFITIKLTGLATRLGQSKVEPVNGCVTELPAAAGVQAAFVRTALVDPLHRRTRRR